MEVSTIIVDNGAYTIRAGIGGDSEPQTIVPAIIGRPTKGVLFSGMKDVYVGSEAYNQQGVTFKSPIEDRIITNFDDMEKIWSHIFSNELQVNMEEHPILLTESIFNSKEARKKSVQLLMETFKVPAYYTTSSSLLSLYASGKTTGVAVDCGETITTILPIYESFSMTHVAELLEIGGRQLNNYLRSLLLQEFPLQQSTEREVLRDIKEKFCYVAENPIEEAQKYEHSSDFDCKFNAPDGNQIVVKSQRYRCPELLFKPDLMNIPKSGLVQRIKEAISQSDEDLRQGFYENIIFSGGTSMFKGIGERVEKDLTKIAPGNVKVKILCPPNRRNSAWIGGSQLVSLATFSQMWVTRSEYDETGPEIVNLKCF